MNLPVNCFFKYDPELPQNREDYKRASCINICIGAS